MLCEKTEKNLNQYNLITLTFDSSFPLSLRWFNRCTDTILGETVDDPRELVAIDECENVSLSSVVQVISIKQVFPDLKQWADQGELNDSDVNENGKDDSGTLFWYRFYYNRRFGRFEYPPVEPKVINNNNSCACCDRLAIARRGEYAKLGPKIAETISTFQSVEWNRMNFRPGDAVFMDPDTYIIQSRQSRSHGQVVNKVKVNTKSLEQPEEYDEEMYPEKYRKTKTNKAFNQDTPDPFCIGYIVSIKYNGIIRELIIEISNSILLNFKLILPSILDSKINAKDIQISVSRLYRPADTHLGKEAEFNSEWNMVYWTSEIRQVSLAKIVDKCVLICSTAIDQTIEEFNRQGPYRFYFNKAYNPTTKEFEALPSEAERIGSSSEGKDKHSVVKEDSSKFSQTTLVRYKIYSQYFFLTRNLIAFIYRRILLGRLLSL